MKLIPKCQDNSGNAFGNMGKTYTKKITLIPSGHHFTNGQEGYYYQDSSDKTGTLSLATLDKNNLWKSVGLTSDGNYATSGTVSFMGDQNLVGENGEELVVTPKSSSWRSPVDYKSTYDGSGESLMEFFNAVTAGGLNNLSPTLWARRAWDLRHVANGNMSFSNYADRWVNGNEGIVTRNFNLEHPYWSMAINGLGDAAAGYGLYKGLKLLKPLKSPGTNLGEEVAQISDLAGNYSMSSEKFGKVFEDAKERLLSFYHSKNYENRARLAGLSDEELESTIKLLDQALNRTKGVLVGTIDKSKGNALAIKGATVKGSTATPYLEQNALGKWFWKDGEIKMTLDNWGSEDEFIQSLDHEDLHASSLSSNGKGSNVRGITSSGQKVRVDAGTSLIDKNLEYDKALQSKNVNPAYLSKETFTATVKKQHPNATPEQIENGWNLSQYVLLPTEWRSRGLSLQLEANRQGKTLLDYIKSNPMSNINYSQMRKFATPQQIYNYSSRALGFTAPVGLGLKYFGEEN